MIDIENRQKVDCEAVGGEVEAIIGGLDLVYVNPTLPLRSVGFRLPCGHWRLSRLAAGFFRTTLEESDHCHIAQSVGPVPFI